MKIKHIFTATHNGESFKVFKVQGDMSPKDILEYFEKKKYGRVTTFERKTLQEVKKSGYIGFNATLRVGKNVFFVEESGKTIALVINTERHCKPGAFRKSPLSKKFDKTFSVFIHASYQGYGLPNPKYQKPQK